DVAARKLRERFERRHLQRDAAAEAEPDGEVRGDREVDAVVRRPSEALAEEAKAAEGLASPDRRIQFVHPGDELRDVPLVSAVCGEGSDVAVEAAARGAGHPDGARGNLRRQHRRLRLRLYLQRQRAAGL